MSAIADSQAAEYLLNSAYVTDQSRHMGCNPFDVSVDIPNRCRRNLTDGMGWRCVSFSTVPSWIKRLYQSVPRDRLRRSGMPLLVGSAVCYVMDELEDVAQG